MLDEWKTAEARERYMTLYRTLRAETWGDKVTERSLDTALGPTRLFEWSGDGDPVVLLHGANTNAFMWASVIPHLAGRHVIAPDMPGDPGESELRAPVTSFDPLVEWVLEIVGDRKVHLVGASYGAVLATHVALAHPDRIASLTLVEPVLVKLAMAKFMVHGIATGLAVSIPGPQRKPLAHALGAGDVVENVALRKMSVMGFRFHQRKALPAVVPFSDEQLVSLAVPTAVLLGRHSSVHNARQVAAWLASVNPSLAVTLVPDGHHTLPVTHASLIASTIPSH